jgi:hemoglobin-like flavoprotein
MLKPRVVCSGSGRSAAVRSRAVRGAFVIPRMITPQNRGLPPNRHEPRGMRLALILRTPEEEMTDEDTRLVQESWSKIEFVHEMVAELFYTRLFELDPASEEIFPATTRERQQKFAAFTSATVHALDRTETLLPVVRALGVRHPELARNDRFHADVALALLWTLEKSLRRDFTPQVKSAWIAAYGVLSQTLRTSLSSEAQAA